MERDVIIIGGGLAGLIHARLLADAGLDVCLIEQKRYPFHRVCGEYISNETLPFLQSLGFDPFEHGAARISRFGLSSPKGKRLEMDLDLGGFGLSRYNLDQALYQMALEAGAEFRLGEKVSRLHIHNSNVVVEVNHQQQLRAKVVIGAHGKRSRVDADLNRRFFKKRSPWVGIKHHIRIDHPEDLIELHNFRDGYCGISRVEEDTVCLCYLVARKQLRKYGDISNLEQGLLSQNPQLARIFAEAEFLWERPEVINEISFARKPLIEKGILMSGDAGGMIAPLCGNGMAMAMHSAKLLSAELIDFFEGKQDRESMERAYRRKWRKAFARRLWIGRSVQRFFGNPRVTEGFVGGFRRMPRLSRWVVSQTHGKEF